MFNQLSQTVDQIPISYKIYQANEEDQNSNNSNGDSPKAEGSILLNIAEIYAGGVEDLSNAIRDEILKIASKSPNILKKGEYPISIAANINPSDIKKIQTNINYVSKDKKNMVFKIRSAITNIERRNTEDRRGDESKGGGRRSTDTKEREKINHIISSCE